MLTNTQIQNIIDAKTLTLSTADANAIPRSIILMPSRVESDRIIVCNIQMTKTIENLKQNNSCFVNVYMPDKDDLQYKIEGKAEILSEGELYRDIKNYEENDNGLLEAGLSVKDVIVIHINTFEESKG